MRLPRFEREVIEKWMSGIEMSTHWVPRGYHNDLHKRQGLLAGLLNGVGDILGTNPKTTTTAQAKPTQATQVVSNPPPAPTTQAPPAVTTQAPVVSKPPVVSEPPQIIAPPVQVTTAPAPAPAPTSQIPQPVPVLSSVIQTTSSIPIAIPVVTTAISIPTSPLGNGVLPTTTAISFISSTSVVSLISTSVIISTITSNGVVYPTTFATSTISSPSTTRLSENLTTMNAIMGPSNSGRISKMTIIVSVISILVGSLFIFLVCYFISQNYIKKRKITIALDMRISQLQQGDGPLPPVPMRMKMKNEAMEFMLKFPRPPSLRGMGMGRTSREKERGGFDLLRS